MNRKERRLKIKLIFAFLFGLLVNAMAQQDPMFTQYMHNPVSINPAYAGSRGTLNIVSLHRQQWIGIDGAPKTLALSINTPFLLYNVGVGLSVLYDALGPSRQIGMYADYAYHLKVTDRTKLAFGLKGGINIYEIDLTDALREEEDDLLALYGYKKLYRPNFGIGSYLYNERYYVGFSIPKLLQNSLTEDNNNVVNREERHLFVTGGVVLDVSENIKFKPSAIVRMVKGAPVSSELNASFLLHDRLWLGGMYRFRSAAGALVKFDITRQLSLGYSFDYTFNELGNYNQGTHEAFISYDVVLKSRKVLSPRYF